MPVWRGHSCPRPLTFDFDFAFDFDFDFDFAFDFDFDLDRGVSLWSIPTTKDPVHPVARHTPKEGSWILGNVGVNRL